MSQTKDQERRDAFFRLARVLEIYIVDSDGEECDTRLLNEPLISNQDVTVGASLSGGSYREHVVPRIVLVDECTARFMRGQSAKEVAELLEKFLKVVLITKEEKDRIDASNQCNLKMRMPDGWGFETRNPYARLHAAQIEFKLYAFEDTPNLISDDA